MTDAIDPRITRRDGPAGLVGKANAILASIPLSLATLALRFALAIPFYRSGMTKWDGFLQLSDGAKYLFQEEFKLNLFGAQYGFPAPDTVAFAAGLAEVILPVLLLLGLGTRFAAFGLLIMTGVIQLVYPDGWASFHLPWAAMALAIVVCGPGRVSIDHLIRERFKNAD